MGVQCRKLGVFGGTFNPIHIGHLRLAEDVREVYKLDKVVFIPTHIPPHKQIQGSCTPLDRVEMVELAIAANDHFLCDNVEVNRGDISYTIDTIHYVYHNYRFEDKPYLILGSDLLSELNSWKDIDKLLKKVRFIVLVRDSYPIKDDGVLKKLGAVAHTQGVCLFYTKRKIDITSSEIRKRLKEGLSIRYLVPDRVYQFIEEKKLYVWSNPDSSRRSS